MQGTNGFFVGLIGLAAVVGTGLGCGNQVVVSQEIEEVSGDYLETSQEGKPDLSEAEQAIVEKTNEYRQEQGLEALTENERLNETASYFAAYMASTSTYGHNADGNRPADRASYFDYDFCIISENIAMQLDERGFTTQELGNGFFEGWLNSKEHHEAMVDPAVTETGVAVAHNSESGRYFAVQMFGRPKSKAIRFQVINRSGEQQSYTVSNQANGEADKEYTIPPRGIRTHLRCRPTVLDWGWTDEQEKLEGKSGTAFTIEQMGDDLEIEEGEMNQRAAG